MQKVYMQHENDCMTCCLAMVLDLPYKDVPRFFNDDNTQVGDGYFEEVRKFLNSRYFQSVTVEASFELLHSLKGLYIVAGPSYTPKFKDLGIYHAVVYKDGELWCDPLSENPIGRIEPEVIDLIIPIFDYTY